MSNKHSNLNELLASSKLPLSEPKSAFQMAFQINSAICEHERSTSRSSVSSNSSIIDPGDEKSDLSIEDASYESPKKKRCTDYNRVHFDCPSRDLESKDPSNSNESQSTEKCKPRRSFLIKDILSQNSKNEDCKNEPRGFIRPWDIESSQNCYLSQLNAATSLFQSLQYNAISTLHPNFSIFQNSYQSALNNYRVIPNRRPRSADDDSRSERSESDSPESPASNSANNAVSSPLDALFEMTSKAFDRNDGSGKSADPSSDHLNLFNNRASQIKKKRKSRTAFTNHQIFELEKRFLYQKYLSPADRDEIAQSLGLTNAQVITWFQNRRAKLKRDVEELKKDVDAAKISSVHNSLLENIQDLSIMKKSEIVAALHQHAQHANN